MITIIITLLSISVLILVASIFCGFRNELTYKIRSWFIDNRFKDFHTLPSYDSMLYNPRYWANWTKNSWVKWVDSQKKI